jgi:fission process protein 1
MSKDASTPAEPSHEEPSVVEQAERYAAFGLRLRQLGAIKTSGLKATTIAKAVGKNARYTAYSSDVGEAFRPVVPRWAVNATYGVAIAYIASDIGMTTYKESQKPDDDQTKNIVRAAAHATIFQGIASLVGPAILIHQTVHFAQGVAKRSERFQMWGPTIAGLALIPVLPALFDEPSEHLIDWAFDTYWPAPGGGHGGHGGAAGGSESFAAMALRSGASDASR